MIRKTLIAACLLLSVACLAVIVTSMQMRIFGAVHPFGRWVVDYDLSYGHLDASLESWKTSETAKAIAASDRSYHPRDNDIRRLWANWQAEGFDYSYYAYTFQSSQSDPLFTSYGLKFPLWALFILLMVYPTIAIAWRRRRRFGSETGTRNEPETGT